MKTLVLYYRHGVAGFASAFLWWKKFGDTDHVYRGHQNMAYLNTEEFDRFVFLDCCPKARDVRNILKSNKKIVLIDRHQMANDTLGRLYSNERDQFEKVMFDSNRSTVSMTVEYLDIPHPEKFIQYIEDRDLSKFSLENTREINIAISNIQKDFNEWNKIFSDWEKGLVNLLIAGKTLVNYQDLIVSVLVKHDHIVWFKYDDQTEVPLINSNLYQSEIGKLLCRLLQVKFAGCFNIRGNMVNIHIHGKGADIFAKAYGGNGDYKYAGFMIPFKDFYDKVRK